MSTRRDDLASWGRVQHSTPIHVLDVPWSGSTPPWSAEHHPLLAYGQGRSYGDVCLNNGGTILRTVDMRMLLDLDAVKGTLRVEAGCTLDAVLRATIPRGWWLPVVPGTRFVSVGGAIANDIHGKNHHRRGSFGVHVLRIEILRSDGNRYVCSRTEHADLFAATIGGMGLTGLITWAELQLMPIASTIINVERRTVRSLDEALDTLAAADPTFEYTVCWIDTTAPERAVGRGHVLCGNHADTGPLRTEALDKQPLLRIPVEAPSWLLNKYSVGMFNTLYYYRQRAPHTAFASDTVPFFWPLDAIGRWNRLYGKRGMIQYQVVVPIEQRDVIRRVLIALRQAGFASFLGVLKTFGTIESPGMLSFPRPGITLALDLANQGARMMRLLDTLDTMVVEAGGALYPAKDVRMSAATFRSSFPKVDAFRTFVDPAFSSTFWRRVTLEQP